MEVHERALLMGSHAIYPFSQKLVDTYNIAKGSFTFVKENLYRGRLPKMLFVTMVASEAFVGSYTRNPFNFQHFGVNMISLKKDGESIPAQAYEPNFTASNYLLEYMQLAYACNIANDTMGLLAFSQDEYPNGYCFFVFCLTPDMSMTTSEAQQSEPCNLRLELKFSGPLAENVTLLTMGLFDGWITVDANRQCHVSEI